MPRGRKKKIRPKEEMEETFEEEPEDDLIDASLRGDTEQEKYE